MKKARKFQKVLFVSLIVGILAAFVLISVAEAGGGAIPCRRTTYNWRARTRTVCYDMFYTQTGRCPKGWSTAWWIVDNLRLAQCAVGAGSCCQTFKIWEVWQ